MIIASRVIKIIRTVLISSIIYTSYGCQSRNEITPKTDLNFIAELTIGSEHSDSSYYNFGRIDDIHVDKKMNIYICDYTRQEVYVYDSSGVFIKRINTGIGQGPGECIGPRLVRTMQTGEIVIYDQKQNKLILYDHNCHYLKDIKILDMTIAKMEISDTTLMATGQFHIYSGGIIHTYNLHTGELLGSFGSRLPDSIAISRTGNWDLIACRNNDILLSRSYPYQIDCFGSNHSFKKSISRSIHFEKPPRPIKVNGNEVYGWSYVPKAICVMPDGHILHFLAHFEDDAFKSGKIRKKVHFYCDVFDPNDECVLTFPIPSHGIENDWIRIVSTDAQGNIYMDYNEPFPHVVKYRVIMKPTS